MKRNTTAILHNEFVRLNDEARFMLQSMPLPNIPDFYLQNQQQLFAN